MIKLYCNTPLNTALKLNTDGNALENLGRIGGGGILRNSNREMIYAYATPLGFGTNN